MRVASRTFRFISLLGILITGCVVTPSQAPQRSPLEAHVSYDEYPARIPFKRTPHDLPIVLAETENGKLWMLLDTGCDSVIFSPRTAKRTDMYVLPVPSAYSTDAGGNARRIDGLSPVQRLSLGPAHFYGFVSIVNDIGNVYDREHAVGGVAGLPLFADTLLTIDYARNQLIIEPGALPPPDGKQILPMSIDGGKISVRFDLGERSTWMMLDTGFSGFIILPRERVAEFPGAETKLASGTAKVFYGTEDLDYAQLRDDLRIGQHTIQHPIVAIGGAGNDVMMGAQYLKQFVVTIDQKHGRIRFAGPDKRPVFVPAWGPEVDREITMLNRLMDRPTTAPAGPSTQPAVNVNAKDLRL